jgi:hypothetical protein
MTLEIEWKRWYLFLVVAALFLMLMGIIVQLCKYVLGHDYLFGLMPLFSLTTDISIPTWYSSFSLLLCAILIAIISVAKKRSKDGFAFHWQAMSLIFLFLSLDETARIHETIGETLKFYVTGKTHGLLRYTWVIFGMAFVAAFVGAYLKFLFHLPARVRWMFILAGAVYVGGALGMDMLNGRYHELHGDQNLTYQMMTVLEESMEMAGILIFIRTLILYLLENAGSVSLRIGTKESSPESMASFNL